MNIVKIAGATRTLGESQGYIGLPLRDELQHCSVGGEGTPTMKCPECGGRAEAECIDVGVGLYIKDEY